MCSLKLTGPASPPSSSPDVPAPPQATRADRDNNRRTDGPRAGGGPPRRPTWLRPVRCGGLLKCTCPLMCTGLWLCCRLWAWAGETASPNLGSTEVPQSNALTNMLAFPHASQETGLSLGWRLRERSGRPADGEDYGDSGREVRVEGRGGGRPVDGRRGSNHRLNLSV